MRLPNLALCALFLGPALWHAQSTLADDQPRTLDLPVALWLQAGEHKDFKTRVSVRGPFFGYQQRHLLRVFTTIDLKRLQKSSVERDLHILLKVADEDGQWAPDETYAHAEIRDRLRTATDLVLTSQFFFQPGRYTLAVIVFDRRTQQRSVTFHRLKVPAIGNDPLPHLARDLPRIEFLEKMRPDALPLGAGRAHLPVETVRPLLIDVVTDFGAHAEQFEPRLQSWDSSRMVQVASLLSQIQPSRGCVRVTGLDVLRLKTLYWREAADRMDWLAEREKLLGRSLHTVEITELAARLQAAEFLRDRLQQLWGEPARCEGVAGPVDRAVIFVGHGVFFPPGTRVEPAQVAAGCDCRFYYLRLEPNQLYLFDMVPKILRPIAPRLTTSRSPEQFRRDLATLLRSLGRPDP
jgi:hypothetical protein